MRVFKLKCKRGKLHVAADSLRQAERQRDAFDKGIHRRWIRCQAEIKPGVYALGSEAKRRLGVAVYEPPEIHA